jgi:hypothetical protein
MSIIKGIFTYEFNIFPPHHRKRPQCVKRLQGRHSVIEVKFKIHEKLVLSLGKYRINNFMNNQRLVRTPSPNVIKYFQLGNVHLIENKRLQTLKHIALCTCWQVALWENSSYNLDLQITKYILVHNL